MASMSLQSNSIEFSSKTITGARSAVSGDKSSSVLVSPSSVMTLQGFTPKPQGLCGV